MIARRVMIGIGDPRPRGTEHQPPIPQDVLTTLIVNQGEKGLVAKKER